MTISEGAEGEQVTFDDVVPMGLFPSSKYDDGQMEVELLTAGFAWFQLLMTGSYLGAASALVERVLLNDQVPESERVRLLVQVEGAMLAAERVALRLDAGDLEPQPRRRHVLARLVPGQEALGRPLGPGRRRTPQGNRRRDPRGGQDDDPPAAVAP
ncbi:hypothetical protein [Streptosporangium sp. NPDC002607]